MDTVEIETIISKQCVAIVNRSCVYTGLEIITFKTRVSIKSVLLCCVSFYSLIGDFFLGACPCTPLEWRSLSNFGYRRFDIKR